MKYLALAASFLSTTLAIAIPGDNNPPSCSTVTKTVPTTVSTTVTTTVPTTVSTTVTTTETVTVTATKPCKPTETCPHPHNWNKGLGDNSQCSDSCSHRETEKNGETITCEPAGPGCKKHCMKCKKHPKCDGASDGDACDEDGYCRSGECVWLVNKKQCGE